MYEACSETIETIVCHVERVGYGWVMVEVGYGRGRVGSELSQLGSRWFVHACY